MPRPSFQGVFTVEDAIQVDNNIVFNALVENAKIESACLFRTNTMAENTCFLGPKESHTLINHVSGCYTMDGRYTTIRGGNKYNTFASFDRAISFNRQDDDHELRELNNDLISAQKRFDDFNVLYLNSKKEYDKQNKLLENTKQKLSKLLNLMNKEKLEDKISQLRLNLLEVKGDTAMDTTDWENEVMVIKKDIGEQNEFIEKCDLKRKEVQKVVNNKNIEKQTFSNTAFDLTQKMRNEEDKMNLLIRNQNKFKYKIENNENKVKDDLLKLTTVEQQVEQQLEKVEVTRDKAQKYTLETLGAKADPVTVTNETNNQLEVQIKCFNLQRKDMLKLIKGDEKDIHEASRKVKKEKQIYDEKTVDLRKVEENKCLLLDDFKSRIMKWKRERKSTSNLTSKKFDEVLQFKGQCGRIDFSHRNMELYITVQNDNRDSQSQIENVKLLSGGERSFATLSLLISLGESVECPFRVIDEFDVFMDVVSRKVCV
mmetsp:Transcript_18594/g.22048  ORF Transcript_18594/g.22048 Transcript_18594/m.22048 type:complete len:485 (-) Transcript_18594:46-1500(-)